MTREVRIGLRILTVLLLAALVTPALGFYPPVPLLLYGWPLLPLAILWGMLDAAYHRDSVWREADPNKVDCVLVQLIPLVGTMAYYILVHPTVVEASPYGAGSRFGGAIDCSDSRPRPTKSVRPRCVARRVGHGRPNR
jgi:hypothetical protein